MKKMLALLLVVMMILPMAACGSKNAAGDKSACRKRPRRFRRKGYH